MIKVSPSILASDFTNLEKEINAMLAAGADMIHLDVMDGHFVSNITFGAPVIKSIRKKTDAFLDTHLMISEPLKFVKDFVDAGSDCITFHLESDDAPEQVIEEISSYNVHAGIALRPTTSIDGLLEHLPKLKQVLLMTVEPGFGGQPFMAHMPAKILELRKYREAHHLSFDIQVDGGIDNNTAPIVGANGATILIAGSSLFSKTDYKKAVENLKQAALSGLENRLF